MMTAKYYEEPPQNVIHLYDEEDGVWSLKDDVVTASLSDDEHQGILEFDHEQKLGQAEGVGDVEPDCNCGQSLTGDGLHAKHCNTLQYGVGDVDSDKRGSGARYNSGKPPMHYIPFRQQLLVYRPYFEITPELSYLQELLINLALFEQREISISEIVEKLEIADLHDAAYVWDYGAQKYAAYNWAKGMKWSVPMGCISRHVQAILMGENIDDESGCKHWGHIVCNLLMLEHYYHFFKEGDDRPNVEVFRTS